VSGSDALVLRDVRRSFGRTLALLCENGAGKTTLMRIAFGLLAPDAGELWVNGERTTLRSSRDGIALGLGMVHQHFMLVPAMTVAENVALGGRGRFDRDATAGRIAAIAKDAGLEHTTRAS
jgi:general nucleoside transport system ATP-binding protein